MTVATTARKAILAGNGINTNFAFNFAVRSAADLQVYYTDANGVQTLLAANQYSVALSPVPNGQLWAQGGSVTYPLAGAAIGAGTELTIARNVPLTQTSTLINQGGYSPQTVEQMTDLLAMAMQQVNEILARALTIPISSSANTAMPAPLGNALLGWDATGANIINVAAAGSIPLPLNSTLVSFLRTGAGAVARTVQSELNDVIKPQQFGAAGNGVTVDDAAFAAMLTQAAATGQNVDLGGLTYKLNTGIVIDLAKYTVYGHGATLDFSGLLAGSAVTIYTATASAVYYRSRRHMLEGVEIAGPGKASAGSIGVTFGGTVLQFAAQTSLLSVVIHDFEKGAVWQNNAYTNSFDQCSFYNCGTCEYFDLTGVANTGERITHIDCDFFNSDQVLNIVNGASDIEYVACSFDFFTNYVVQANNGGRVHLSQCHVEGSGTAANWFKNVSGTTNAIVIEKCYLVLSHLVAGVASHVTFALELFNSTLGTSSDGGIIVRDCSIGASKAYDGVSGVTYSPDTWGTGYVWCTGATSYDQNAFRQRPWSSKQNILTDGGFETASSELQEWQIQSTGASATGSTGLSVSGAKFRSGAKSMLLAPIGTTAANAAVIQKQVPVGPGAKPTFLLYALSAAAMAGTDTFTVKTWYEDRLGNTIAGTTTTSTYQAGGTTINQNTWTQVIIRPTVPAVLGAVKCVLELNVTDNGNGLQVYVDDCIFEVMDQAACLPIVETGRFVPIISGVSTAGAGTYSVQQGWYTRTGNIVTAYGAMTWSAHTGTGNMVIDKLPFSSKAGTLQPAHNLIANNLTFVNEIAGYMNGGDEKIVLGNNATGAGFAALAIDTAATLYFSITYEIKPS